MNKVKEWLQQYKHGWVFLYALIYIPWFVWLEQRETEQLYIIHSELDQYIPFVKWFIIPYFLWFFFIVLTEIYFFLMESKENFYRLTLFLCGGMTIFLMISTVFPNGLELRPAITQENGILFALVRMLYHTDTATNVFPSVHVFNSIGAYIAIAGSEKLGANKWIRYGALVLTGLIVASTVFLKQHSIVDVAGGILLAGMMYQIVYVLQPIKSSKLSKQLAQH